MVTSSKITGLAAELISHNAFAALNIGDLFT
jgi:hypothetical protein